MEKQRSSAKCSRVLFLRHVLILQLHQSDLGVLPARKVVQIWHLWITFAACECCVFPLVRGQFNFIFRQFRDRVVLVNVVTLGPWGDRFISSPCPVRDGVLCECHTERTWNILGFVIFPSKQYWENFPNVWPKRPQKHLSSSELYLFSPWKALPAWPKPTKPKTSLFSKKPP